MTPVRPFFRRHPRRNSRSSFSFNPSIELLEARETPAITITEFPIGLSAGNNPFGVAAGADGNIWVSEFDTAVGGVGGILRVTPTGVVSEFTNGISSNVGPRGITVGPDGNIWFTEAGVDDIGRITPGGVVTEFNIGSNIGGALGIVTGPDGNFWITDSNVVRRVTLGGVVTTFNIPGTSSGLGFITLGSDGNLWFTNQLQNAIDRITPTGVVTQFTAGISVGATPYGITSGPDGNLWFTEHGTQSIGRITPTGVVTEFNTHANQPNLITSGPDGNLWYTSNSAYIDRLTIAGVDTSFPTGSVTGTGEGIALGPDGNLWYSDNTFDKVGRVSGFPLSLGQLSPPTWSVNRPGYTGDIPIFSGTGPYSLVSQSGLPPGLNATITGSNVTFAGTPTVVGIYSNVQITVMDATSATATRTFTITINPQPTLGALSPTQWTVNQPGYTGAIPITGGGPFTLTTASGLPPGLNALIAGSTVTFTGTPTTIGTYNLGLTIQDAAGDLVSGTYTITIVPGSTPGPISGPTSSPTRADFYVTGADAGGGPQVNVYDSLTNQLRYSFDAFAPSFHGGVRVAVGDLNGDGQDEIIAGAGPGGGPQVTVWSAQTGQLLASFWAINGISPFGVNETGTAAVGNTGSVGLFTGGLYVASGDVFGLGHDDIIIGCDAGGGPEVQVFDGKTFKLVASFFAFAPNFTGGVRVAAGELTGTGAQDIICAAGKGGGPQVTVFTGSGGLLYSFYAYAPSFTGGVYVTAGDVLSKGYDDIITGAGPGGGPQVNIFDTATRKLAEAFFATNTRFTGGVRVAADALNGSSKVAILTALGSGAAPELSGFDSTTLNLLARFYAYSPGFTRGFFVGD